MTQAIILLAHGSRDPLWKQPIEAVARQIQVQAPTALVSCSYLELTEPDLPQCASNLIAKGALSIRIFPLFLGMGKHARADIPELMTQLQEQHPSISFELLPAAGERAELIELLAHLAVARK